jgi:PTH2 family peptidyl-tRNA hydrolase
MTPTRHPAFQALLDERLRTMAEFTIDHRPLNLYALYRADLEMPPGKLAAQCGHAYDMAHDLAKIERPAITAQYKGTGNGTKICMYAKNEAQLARAYDDAKAAGIPVVIIVDRGHILLPHFDGKPIVTALGIGPAYRDEVENFMKRYTNTR